MPCRSVCEAGLAHQLAHLRVARRPLAVARVERLHHRRERFGKQRWMKQAREPLDTEQSVGRRRSFEPAEWYVGRHADAPADHESVPAFGKKSCSPPIL